ncbi:hypothetical protein HD806DRAFT_482430 [Xylariaceae sp. AK1471]|nr:hypothetical protein HD806DRAFT_482430 [Xylariaceae sp. AK1471]
MHSSILFTIPFIAATALADCFSGGENWASQKAMALATAQDICNNKFSAFSFAANQELGGCSNLDSSKKVDFILQNISDAPRTPSAAECYDGFQKEINGCDNGGSSSYTNWKYT